MSVTSDRAHAPLSARRLHCEWREDLPCVADDCEPRFGWTLAGDGRGRRQTGYRIIVAEHLDDIRAGRGTLWDSGVVHSPRTSNVTYEGRPLPPATTLQWAVQVWDEDGRESPWSAPAGFRTGLYGSRSWTAEWIRWDASEAAGTVEPSHQDDPESLALGLRPAIHLRRTFSARDIRRATLYTTARGVVEMFLNGEPTSDAVLAPGWTDYRKRLEYAVHDVTDLLEAGDNVLGAILADGWYAGYVGFDRRRAANHYGDELELLCELHLEHDDGTHTIVTSDGRWRATDRGPLRGADLLHGERYDARRDLDEWASPDYDEADWDQVLVRERDATLLVPERAQPIRVTERLEPVARSRTADGAEIVDFGQNLVGWVRLRVRGTRGDRIRLRFAEMLEPDGSLHTANLRSAVAADVYTLGGQEEEQYEPAFTFHGFRYVEVRSESGAPAVEQVSACVVGSDLPRTASFSCSDPLLDQLWRNILWSQRGNFLSIPTDCPQRDERLGWLGDAQVFLPTAAYNMNVAAFMEKWMDDVADAQSEEGAFPDVAPRLVVTRDGAPAWADAGVIVPWTLYRYYGDVRVLERHWDRMERFMEYLHRHNPDLVRRRRRGHDYGDWLNLNADTPRDLLATAYWANSAQLMADIAAVLGRPAREAHYRALHEGVRQAFRDEFIAADGSVPGDTQTGYLLVLAFDLAPRELRGAVMDRLVDNLAEHGNHLTTGFLGVGLLCQTLADNGRSDLAHELLRRDDYPSWGYSIAHGATTMWERWDGHTEAGFQTANMNSFNHYSLGSVAAWMIGGVAGIAPQEPGFEHVLVAPTPGQLEWAEATYESIRGTIRTTWRQSEDGIELGVEVPPNVTATIHLEDRGQALSESETDVRSAAGIRQVRRGDGLWRIEVGSGQYRFRAGEPAMLGQRREEA